MKLSVLLLLSLLVLISLAKPNSKNVLQATLDTFSGAVFMRDKAKILRVFNMPNVNEHALDAYMKQMLGTGYVVISASYQGKSQIEGIVASSVTTARGTTSSNKKIIIRKDAGSPTQWKIFSVS